MCFSSVNLTSFANFLEIFLPFFLCHKIGGKKKENPDVLYLTDLCTKPGFGNTHSCVVSLYALGFFNLLVCVLCSWIVESLDLNT